MKTIKRETAGEDLLKIIHENGLTQKEVAEKSELTEATVSKIIGGQKPNALTLLKLNNYLVSQNGQRELGSVG